MAGPVGLIPLLPNGVTPVRKLPRLIQYTFMPPCSFAAAGVPSAVKTKVVWPAFAPGAGDWAGPGTAIAEAVECSPSPMQLPETVGQ